LAFRGRESIDVGGVRVVDCVESEVLFRLRSVSIKFNYKLDQGIP
jgi:hypothetical protein